MLDRILGAKTLRGLAVAGLAGAIALLALGCMVEADQCDNCGMQGGTAGSAGSGPPASEQVITATIETDQHLETTAGEGAGVFIDYSAGGYWHVFTSCDTAGGSTPCDFNVVATVGSGVSVGDAQLENGETSDGDTLYNYADGVEMAVRTWNDFDGMKFTTTPGATVRFEVYLDGVRDARYVYWVGDEAVHNGAPSNPLDLKPSSP